MSEFHKTLMGKKFYERDVPKIVRALEKIAEPTATAKLELEIKILKGWLIERHGWNNLNMRENISELQAEIKELKNEKKNEQPE